MSQTLTIDFEQPMPLFPLPNCVLLPHATIPLHIFEPRYRAMVKDALESNRLIAMALFEGDDWKQNYEGTPPIRDVVCVGYITRYDELADGRYNLLLQGVCRAQVLQELPLSEPYRQAMLTPIDTKAPMEIELADLRLRIETLLGDETLMQLASVRAIHKWFTSDVPTPVLVDLTLMAVCDDLEQRYRMLAEPRVEKRGLWLEHRLEETRRTLEIAHRHEPADLPDHMSLN